MRLPVLIATICTALLLGACGDRSPAPPAGEAPAAPAGDPLLAQARALFAPLPARMEAPGRELSDARVALGRMLYHDPRLSKNHDIACATCHALDSFGVDPRPEAIEQGRSPGHRGQLGGRNSPTVYNAALQIAQFWDGRAADVEEQARGPVLNPVEMAMPDEAAVVRVLGSIPGYVDAFAAAFPDAEQPLSYAHMAEAIGAYERLLVTPGPFDAWLGGDADALGPKALAGLRLFLDKGCAACHNGPGIGGGMYQKLGLVIPYPTEDRGREEVTGNPGDRHVFKVPMLRNVAHTAPYFHDGSVKTLDEAIRLMARHQTTSGELSADEVAGIRAFLDALTGEPPAGLIAAPALPESGPDTPAPDPD